MRKSSEDSLSEGAREVLDNLKDLAAEVMYDNHRHLTAGMRIRLGNVIKNTQRLLDENVC